MWSILVNVPCALEKKVYSSAFGRNVLKTSMRFISSDVSFKTCFLINFLFIFYFFLISGLSVLLTAGSSGLDCILPEQVQPLLPLLLLDLQVLFMLVEPAAHGTCFLGPQIQGLVLLALIEFPEVLFLSLIFCFDDLSIGVSGVLKSPKDIFLKANIIYQTLSCLS